MEGTEMMQLTADNVKQVTMDCMFNEGEDTSNAVKAEGVRLQLGFDPERLAAHRQDIVDLLGQLPDQFKKSKGGGWSFLNACETKDGVQWGEHIHVDSLLTLGIAIGKAKIQLPRQMWASFPGGMPYFTVED
jgi:hypothetical protein